VAPTPERLYPIVQDLIVMDNSTRDAAAQIDLSLVQQASKPNSQSLFVPSKGTLLGSNPGDLLLSDDTSGHRFQKDFAECHEKHVTNP
jgi:hypothetical protein